MSECRYCYGLWWCRPKEMDRYCHCPGQAHLQCVNERRCREPRFRLDSVEQSLLSPMWVCSQCHHPYRLMKERPTDEHVSILRQQVLDQVNRQDRMARFVAGLLLIIFTGYMITTDENQNGTTIGVAIFMALFSCFMCGCSLVDMIGSYDPRVETQLKRVIVQEFPAQPLVTNVESQI